ncbi:MAG: pyroglutamyl-peptidase I [Erysipelotrichaceae bacterium]|nr:pyroglutamyl-peptidase I [Erysipelotrichaceae bacterium]
MKVLVTGFDPFGGEKINPAIESVKKLPDEIAGAQIIKLEIPTVCHKSLDVIDAAIAENDPDVILSIGQAGGRPDITVERVGINVDDCRIPDNAGQQIIDEPVFPDGPAAYFVNLPIKAMVARVQSHNIPASVSNTAGTFVCNHVTYGVRHICETKYPGKKSGFIHIPYLPQQVIDKKGMPSMSLDVIVEALTAAIEAIVDTDEDIKVTGGATH